MNWIQQLGLNFNVNLNALKKRVTALETAKATEDAEEVVGTVTQITSGTTGVTLNTPIGIITTVTLTTAADASFEFTLTNSKVLAASNIQLIGLNSGTGVINASLVSIAAGSAVLRITNTGTAAFNSLVKIHFSIV